MSHNAIFREKNILDKHLHLRNSTVVMQHMYKFNDGTKTRENDWSDFVNIGLVKYGCLIPQKYDVLYLLGTAFILHRQVDCVMITVRHWLKSLVLSQSMNSCTVSIRAYCHTNFQTFSSDIVSDKTQDNINKRHQKQYIKLQCLYCTQL